VGGKVVEEVKWDELIGYTHGMRETIHSDPAVSGGCSCAVFSTTLVLRTR